MILAALLSVLMQGESVGRFLDWNLRCEMPPGALERQCVLTQALVDKDRPSLSLVVLALETADHKARLLRGIAPLGVLLQNGIGLKIDGVNAGRMDFVRCLPSGCVAQIVLDDKLLKSMQNSKTMIFVLFETPEEGVGVPASLAGFREGFAAASRH